MTVKVRTVDAGKLGLTANRKPADSAHPGPVDHDGIHIDHGLDAHWLGDLRDLHHLESAPVDDDPIRLDFFQGQYLGQPVEMPFVPGRTVTDDLNHPVRNRFKPILPIKKIGTTRLQEGINHVPPLLQGAGNGINTSYAVATADTKHGSEVIDFRLSTERSGISGNLVSGFE